MQVAQGSASKAARTKAFPAAGLREIPGGPLRDRLAAFKTPVRVLFSDTVLPRNANGKILKKDLRALFSRA